MRPINEIIIHCTATRPDWWADKKTSAKVAEIKRWHTDKGWRDIGYHYLIDRDGTVATGRPVDQVGAHVQGHNTGTIGISLFGGHGSAETDHFHEHYTPAQEHSLRGLLEDLRATYGAVKITGHNQYAAKACPGFNVPAWLKAIAPRPDYAPEPKRPSSFWADIFAAIAAIFTGAKK